jgi:hypothetical protein
MHFYCSTNDFVRESILVNEIKAFDAKAESRKEKLDLPYTKST